jgi:Arc/MetJ-type ribon-helix-helix transcriptional regulator
MTIDLPRDIEKLILAKVHGGLFPSMDAAMTEAAQLLLERIEQEQATPRTSEAGQDAAVSTDHPIWERVLERTAEIPEEEWAKLPTDLAEQHDHYLYGSPKRTET